MAASELRSLCDRAISTLSHSSPRSAHVAANAATAAHSHTLDYGRYHGANPGYVHEEGEKHEIIFLLITFHFFGERFWLGDGSLPVLPRPADANSCSEPSEGFSSSARRGRLAEARRAARISILSGQPSF